MELEGFIKGMKIFDEYDLPIAMIVTDNSSASILEKVCQRLLIGMMSGMLRKVCCPYNTCTVYIIVFLHFIKVSGKK